MMRPPILILMPNRLLYSMAPTSKTLKGLVGRPVEPLSQLQTIPGACERLEFATNNGLLYNVIRQTNSMEWKRATGKLDVYSQPSTMKFFFTEEVPRRAACLDVAGVGGNGVREDVQTDAGQTSRSGSNAVGPRFELRHFVSGPVEVSKRCRENGSTVRPHYTAQESPFAVCRRSQRAGRVEAGGEIKHCPKRPQPISPVCEFAQEGWGVLAVTQKCHAVNCHPFAIETHPRESIHRRSMCAEIETELDVECLNALIGPAVPGARWCRLKQLDETGSARPLVGNIVNGAIWGVLRE
ncbi:hypothetical protein AND_004103 [Anopheles darlingi]|uniref:Uncharacterized protein n=1 Tax=Anopheles darlingi TaxID=43151 RepID=W5JJ42_ANODA|nr:hypothetical protein AND_004103 [Anopheles darlingi]